MIKESFNADWRFYIGCPGMMSSVTGESDYKIVQLPHDAMIHENRTPNTSNGKQTGFWPGGTYTYSKYFYAPETWINKTVMIEFEGVYETSMIYLNGNLVNTHLNGYTGFYVTLDRYLKYGEENEIKIIANNESEKNSRWYSGSGIYRDVHLLIGDRVHIQTDGVKIDVPIADEDLSVVEVSVAVSNISRLNEEISVISTLIFDDCKLAKSVSNLTVYKGESDLVRQRINVKNAKMWDDISPNLYQCHIQIVVGAEVLDQCVESFGIRRVELDSVRGLRVNGRSVKLRGSCIHHDNGVLGAATFADAEARRCRKLKEAGFNSIRSSHHPVSKAMLRACDKYGIYVMDEVSDMWTNHKNSNDYALHFMENMDAEVKMMVEKDYNHPSVIIYSTGNEIQEIGTPRGAWINRHLGQLFHDLDPNRYTTNAINGMIAVNEKLEVILQDIMPLKATQNYAITEDEKNEGANIVNSFMSLMVGATADALASHPIMTESIAAACQAMDITGLNYMVSRYEMEQKIHPDQPILGTETYPSDIVRIWDCVEKHAHVLGDYTWTGYDYLGEAGIGIYYYDGQNNFSGSFPDRLAYVGDIDLIGYRRPISYLREIVFGIRKAPYIAVERVDKYGIPCSKSPWSIKDSIASWTWTGYEGKPANVDVYSDAEEVELFLNGNSMGRKLAGKDNNFVASYSMSYEPGELLAVCYRNKEASESEKLVTAGNDIVLTLDVENEVLRPNGEDLAFVTVHLTDSKGHTNLFEKKSVTISVDGPGTLQGVGNADPQSSNSYDCATWETFDGYMMGVIRSERTTGMISVTVTANNCTPQKAMITVK